MKFLSELFNRKPATMQMARETLADIVKPVMPGTKSQLEAPDNARIAAGWDEAAEWVRIAFDVETDKGSLYYGLHGGMRQIASAIRSAPEGAQSIAIPQNALSGLKTSYIQLEGAAHYLETMSRAKASYVPRTVHDRHGNELVVPFTQIYNRPNAAHDLAAMRLEEVQDKLEAFFGGDGRKIRAANDRDLAAYKEIARLCR